MNKLKISLLPEQYGVCRCDSITSLDGLLPADGEFYSVTRTAEEVSLVCREDLLPAGFPVEKNFRLFKVEGPLDFSLTGILATLLQPLADAGIAVFTISTYDTDYLLIKAERLSAAISALSKAAEIKTLR